MLQITLENSPIVDMTQATYSQLRSDFEITKETYERKTIGRNSASFQKRILSELNSLENRARFMAMDTHTVLENCQLAHEMLKLASDIRLYGVLNLSDESTENMCQGMPYSSFSHN